MGVAVVNTNSGESVLDFRNQPEAMADVDFLKLLESDKDRDWLKKYYPRNKSYILAGLQPPFELAIREVKTAGKGNPKLLGIVYILDADQKPIGILDIIKNAKSPSALEKTLLKQFPEAIGKDKKKVKLLRKVCLRDGTEEANLEFYNQGLQWIRKSESTK